MRTHRAGWFAASDECRARSSLLVWIVGLAVFVVPVAGQVPPVRLEVQVQPAVAGIVVEALGTEVVRTTGADGTVVLAIPSGMIELLLRTPRGEEMRQTILVPSSGGVQVVEFDGLDGPSSPPLVTPEGDPLAAGVPPSDAPALDAIPSPDEGPPTWQPGQGPPVGVAETDQVGPSGAGDLPPGSSEDPGTAPSREEGEPARSLPLGVMGVLALGLAGALGVARYRRSTTAGPEEPTRAWAPAMAGPEVDRFLEYRLYEVLGRGGMATVWRASDGDGQPVALKVMNPELTGDPELRRKFLREGVVLQRIHESWPESPVVRPLDWGPRDLDAEDGSEDAAIAPWVAMEYLEAPTLMQHLKGDAEGGSGAFSEGGVLRLVRQVAEALRAAHDVGVYHRDLAPDNLLLLSTDPDQPVIRVIDFGVARHEFTQMHTLDGSVFGKPPYMAPEQGLGRPVDGRADLYSLGIILYLLLEGRVPFEDRNPIAVLRMHVEKPLPPLTRAVRVGLRELVSDLLEKHVEDRVADAPTLIRRIDELLTAV